jgi:transposase
MNIVKFRERPRKQCAHCAKEFRPRNPDHAFCWDCFRYGRGAAYIAAAVELFRAGPRR